MKVYKVFKAIYDGGDYQSLETALNRYAREGWKVISSIQILRDVILIIFEKDT